MKRKAVNLRFVDFDTAAEYVRGLGQARTETTGNWPLSEIYVHCAVALECSMSSFPKLFPKLFRATVGRLSFKGLKVISFFPPSLPNVAVPRIEGAMVDAGDAHRRLMAAVDAFMRHPGPWAQHPFFGLLNQAEWRSLQAWHLANHLSYVAILGGKET